MSELGILPNPLSACSNSIPYGHRSENQFLHFDPAPENAWESSRGRSKPLEPHAHIRNQKNLTSYQCGSSSHLESKPSSGRSLSLCLSLFLSLPLSLSLSLARFLSLALSLFSLSQPLFPSLPVTLSFLYNKINTSVKKSSYRIKVGDLTPSSCEYKQLVHRNCFWRKSTTLKNKWRIRKQNILMAIMCKVLLIWKEDLTN